MTPDELAVLITLLHAPLVRDATGRYRPTTEAAESLLAGLTGHRHVPARMIKQLAHRAYIQDDGHGGLLDTAKLTGIGKGRAQLELDRQRQEATDA